MMDQTAKKKKQELLARLSGATTGGTVTVLGPVQKEDSLRQKLDIVTGKTQKESAVASGENPNIQYGPVAEKKDRSWFQRGALGEHTGQLDPYTRFMRTASGTVRDVANDVAAGILGMGESLVDAILYLDQLNPAYAFLKQDTKDQLKSDNRALIEKDLYDENAIAEFLNGWTPVSLLHETMDGDIEEDSVLGDKSDALVQSAGQLAGTAALQAVGVPWFLTTGVTAFGGEVENAYKHGATDSEAGLSGLISAGSEILFEKLSGGIKFGGKTLDDLLTKKLTSKISNKLVRNLVEIGMDAAGEGTEEVMTSLASNLGSSLYREEDLSTILWSEEAMDEYLESYIGGAVLGGASSAARAIQAAAGGRDAVTGLTDREQTVVDAEWKQRITEAEQDGTRLSGKQKNALREQVVDDLKKGSIATESIEKILNIQGEEDLTRRIGKRTVSDDYLKESYRQREQRTKHFEADLAAYTSKERQTVQNAIDSGILNNSRVSHDFVDLLAKLAARRGISFSFTDHEGIRKAGLAVDGAVVNGYVSGEGIAINVQSSRALNSVVGHEITHVLEGTELYGDFAQLMTDYAKRKGEYDSRYEAVKKLYESDPDADVDAELVADLVGDYLFTDLDFIRRLSVENRSLFQRLYDEIKYLCRLATAGSREARQLEAVKKRLEEVFRETKGNVLPERAGNARKNISKKTENPLDRDAGKPYNETGDTKGDEGNGRTDEFRRIQAESKAMSYQRLSEYRAGKPLDGEIRARLSRAFKLELQSAGGLRNYHKWTLLNPSTQRKTTFLSNIDGQTFHDIFEISRKYLENGELVDLHTIETTEDGIGYDDCNNYLTEDGLGGFSITPSGDLISVFNLSEERGFLRTIAPYVKDRVKTLDCYVSKRQNLLNMYSKTFGFKAASIMDYNMDFDHDDIAENHGMPSVAFMVNTDKEIVTRFFSKDQYDDAVAYRDSLISEPLMKKSLSDSSDASPRVGGYTVRGEDVQVQEAVRDDTEKGASIGPVREMEDSKEAEILTETPAPRKKKGMGWRDLVANLVDKQSVFEALSLKTKNRALMAKADFLHRSEARGQHFIGKGTEGVPALADLRAEVERSGLTEEFSKYIYHLHNADRMTLADRFQGTVNKPVFGESVTAEVSKAVAAELETAHPEFQAWAQDVYAINQHLRNMLVNGGVISRETANLWEEMYPHYVPVGRSDHTGVNIRVPLDTGRTGVNAPVKRATGGNGNINPLFDTMADRILQTYRATAKNSFGIELKNTLRTEVDRRKVTVDLIDGEIDRQEELIQRGRNGQPPTFTVFDNGERITFEITEEMYDALAPVTGILSKTLKPLNHASSLHRNLVTQYNPTFMVTNAIKDAQDVLINSQHPARTYACFPQAMKELATGRGQYIREYTENGGEQNTYFDRDSKAFRAEDQAWVRYIGLPLRGITVANSFVEQVPRLAEYMASRKAGEGMEVAMLDAARVTTNFAAGGDFTKFLNRNGASFLNASVQGAAQQVRNVREAKAKGLKGWAALATKTVLAGIPAVILNAMLWEEDEEYGELADHVKENYYVVAKYGNGKFVRIPKGRMTAVIQNAMEQTVHAISGKDELDPEAFLELVVNNIAPNNPMEDNIVAPIMQVSDNRTWYGEDLVPTRLQELPEKEQYDESTDAISIWMGEKLKVSPYKLNYLLDQYSGGVGDVVLPMMTDEAESGDDSAAGKLIAPMRDKFTADSVLNNQVVSDFYDTVEILRVNANASDASDQDILMSKYINGVNQELGELYARKREIQSSDQSDSKKYREVRRLQEQINKTAEQALHSYRRVDIIGNLATVGDETYIRKKGVWTKQKA